MLISGLSIGIVEPIPWILFLILAVIIFDYESNHVIPIHVWVNVWCDYTVECWVHC